jgi:hypothetical protein
MKWYDFVFAFVMAYVMLNVIIIGMSFPLSIGIFFGVFLGILLTVWEVYCDAQKKTDTTVMGIPASTVRTTSLGLVKALTLTLKVLQSPIIFR